MGEKQLRHREEPRGCAIGFCPDAYALRKMIQVSSPLLLHFRVRKSFANNVTNMYVYFVLRRD